MAPVLALALCGVAPAQSAADELSGPAPDAVLPIEVVRGPGGKARYVLGVNRFTEQQLIDFLAGIEPFVARAENLDPGVQLVWRRDGVRGYISVSTSPFAGGPRYLMTLRGEPVRSFEDTAALLVTMTRLGLRVLGATPHPHRSRGAAGADAPRILAP